MKTTITLATALLLAGCGLFYYEKEGAGPADFSRDHRACIRDVAVHPSANQAYGLVSKDLYRACMEARGWVRSQRADPKLGHSFRGIEDDQIVKFDAEPVQPVEDAASASSGREALCRGRHLGPNPAGAGPERRRDYEACLKE